MTLSSIRTPSGMYTIAPFDHRASLAKLLDVNLETQTGKDVLIQMKILFMEAFSAMCSAVLVDPIYGFPAIERKAKNTGLILTLESSGYTDDKTAVPTLIENWGVENVKNNYASAKLLTYYHPGEANAEAKLKLVIELGEYCRHEAVPFIVEPVLYNPASGELAQSDFEEAQLITVQQFQQHCDVLKIQYPGNALACATITANLDVPWILLSRGMTYDKFREALKVSLENGCKGFAAGRSVWQEIGQLRLPNNLPDLEKIRTFLNTTGKERMQELIELTEKFATK